MRFLLKGNTYLFVTIALVFSFISPLEKRMIEVPKFVLAAEESEGSEEDEESESSEYSSDKDDKETTETVTRTYTVIEQVEETVLVTPPAYLSDRDGDNLVDALDPNPDVHQKEFFTDDDGDAIANVYDQFPGLDDLVTFADETDENQNGIIDRYES